MIHNLKKSEEHTFLIINNLENNQLYWLADTYEILYSGGFIRLVERETKSEIVVNGHFVIEQIHINDLDATLEKYGVFQQRKIPVV